MAHIKTSNGILEYQSHMLDFGDKVLNPQIMADNIQLLAMFLDKIGINWGPAFGSLIGIIRNDDFLPWKPVFDIYILKEDEERFKDVLWSLMDVGFDLVRYERRGRYYLTRNNEYIKVFVLTKVCSDIRHSGSDEFIHEKFIQNQLKWNFKGVELNVPRDVDEYLTFQYGEWIIPQKTRWYSNQKLIKYYHWTKTWIQDHLPDTLYYKWILLRRKSDFDDFKKQCIKIGYPIPDNVQLSSMQRRHYKKVLTVGVYDLLHKGHVELFRRARGLGDYLIVAVQDSSYILKYKPSAKVLNSTEDRKHLIKSIRFVDEVLTYTDVDKIVQDIEFDVFITGPDQNHDGFQRAIKWCEEHGKEHFVLGRTEGISSSELKEKIIEKTKIAMNTSQAITLNK